MRANYKILRAMRANHKIACHEKKIWLEKFFRGSYDLENVILGQICVPGGKNQSWGSEFRSKLKKMDPKIIFLFDIFRKKYFRIDFSRKQVVGGRTLQNIAQVPGKMLFDEVLPQLTKPIMGPRMSKIKKDSKSNYLCGGLKFKMAIKPKIIFTPFS